MGSTTLQKIIYSNLSRNMLTGLLTIVPLIATLFIFNMILEFLSSVGQPLIKSVSLAVRPFFPILADWLVDSWMQPALAVILVLLLLYFLGLITNLVVGQQLLRILDVMMQKIPFVQGVYGSMKKLIQAMQTKPDGPQRVVLIEFPSRDMKTVGLVTSTFNDSETGEPLAAVYVPTTPNPTSGYMEIVPQKNLVSTDWSMDEAMAFIVSGGVMYPGRIRYFKNEDSVSGSEDMSNQPS